MTEASISEAFLFDVRGISRRFRHAAFFGALESLNDGETMRFVNDHDPLALLQQIELRYGDQIAIRYVQRQPEQIVIDLTVTVTAAGEKTAAQYGDDNACGGRTGCGGTGG